MDVLASEPGSGIFRSTPLKLPVIQVSGGFWFATSVVPYPAVVRLAAAKSGTFSGYGCSLHCDRRETSLETRSELPTSSGWRSFTEDAFTIPLNQRNLLAVLDFRANIGHLASRARNDG